MPAFPQVSRPDYSQYIIYERIHILVLLKPDLGHSDTSRNGVIDSPSGSADDDFLTRERALLGDDADQFASANDHSTSGPIEDDEEDLLGGGSYGNTQTKGPDVKRFESSFPEVEETRNEVNIPST